MSESDERHLSEQGQEASPARDRAPRWRRRRSILLAAAVLLVLATQVPPISVTQLGYYERYPSLSERMNNWRHSTHARMSCVACHVEPGTAGAMRFWAKAMPAFYSQVLSGVKDDNVLDVPSQQACRKCHTTYRRVSASGDLLVPHRAHVELVKIDCAVCHKDLVHSSNRDGFNQPEMSTCMNLCHDGTKATDMCQKCHTRKQVPVSHKRSDFLQVHNTLTEEINCGQCHGWSPDYCKQCHTKRPRSHTGVWKQGHQVRANKRGIKGCVFCHEGGIEYCMKCHDDGLLKKSRQGKE